MAGFANVIQVPVTALDEEGFAFRGRWNRSFFKNDHPVILELGCGKGEYTVELGKRYPDMNFIGVDIKGARMWKGAKDAMELKLLNVAFLRTKIEFIDRFFAPAEIARIWLTFPDPQMKNARRRLTGTNLMEKYREILVREGTIHLKTDSAFQYQYTLEMVKENGLELMTAVPDVDLTGPDEILSIRTFYEKQWRGRGIPIKYLVFRLNHDEPLREPVVQIEKDPYRSFGRSLLNGAYEI